MITFVAPGTSSLIFNYMNNPDFFGRTTTLNWLISNLSSFEPFADGSFEQALSDFLRLWVQGEESFLFHTSGSTGKPKPIRFSRQAMIQSAKLTGNFLGLKSGDTALLCLPMDFVAGKMMLVRTLVLNLKLVICKPSSNPLLQVQAGTTLNFAAMTPMQVAACLEVAETAQMQREIKTLIIGGAPLGNSLDEVLRTFPFPVYETYGMTETLTHIAMRKVNGKEQRDVFNALPGIHLSLDRRGCLVVDAPHLDEPKVITNDLVELAAPNSFRWLGRADHVINTGGIKVMPEQLEKKLEGFITHRFIISSRPDEKLGERIILIIEGNYTDKEAVAEKASLAGIFTKIMLPHEKPREIFFTPKLPETTGGKLKRKDMEGLSPV